MTSTHDIRSSAPADRDATSVAATAGVDAGSPAPDLGEALRLSRSLVARARHLDNLRRRHGAELLAFPGTFAPLFEDVERAVAGLVRTRSPADPNPTIEGDR